MTKVRNISTHTLHFGDGIMLAPGAVFTFSGAASVFHAIGIRHFVSVGDLEILEKEEPRTEVKLEAEAPKPKKKKRGKKAKKKPVAEVPDGSDVQ